jgi:Alpha/beta hydrolase domain
MNDFLTKLYRQHQSKAVACGLAAFLSLMNSAPAEAAIVDLKITKSSRYGTFKAGEFVRIEGELKGALDTSEPIPGLNRAPKNAQGRVAYSAPFVIIMPTQGVKGNGALLIDVPNRGRPISHFLYNSGRENFLPLDLDARTGFLQHHGFTVGMVQWELGQGITLPSFVDEAGVTRFVEGVGLAAIRDFAALLRSFSASASGSNQVGAFGASRFDALTTKELAPLVGQIDRVLAVGYSQTARLLKSLLIEGFNHVDKSRVFDGLHLHASASGLADVLVTGKGPASSTFFTPRFTHPEHRGVTEEPLSYEAIVSKMVLNDRSETSPNTKPPLLIVTNATTDYYNIRASLSRTGANGLKDLPVPSNVRIYDIAGASHGRALEKSCEQLPGRLDFFPVMRVSLLHLDRWVAQGRQPPGNRLMPLEPLPRETSLLQAPLHLPGAIAQVPQRDPDGNSLGGVRLPELVAPLGTHGAQNMPLSNRACNLNAAYIPFAATRAKRSASDTRLSVVERYPSREHYLKKIRAAGQQLIREEFLLAEDLQAIENAAQKAY